MAATTTVPSTTVDATMVSGDTLLTTKSADETLADATVSTAASASSVRITLGAPTLRARRAAEASSARQGQDEAADWNDGGAAWEALLTRLPSTLAACLAFDEYPKVLTALTEASSKPLDTLLTPWVNAQVVDFLGEEEPTMRDFIVEQIRLGLPMGATSLLEEVRLVLEEDAVPFVRALLRNAVALGLQAAAGRKSLRLVHP